ncbi:hypothetical protein D3C72_2080310 [compost metagenome]
MSQPDIIGERFSQHTQSASKIHMTSEVVDCIHSGYNKHCFRLVLQGLGNQLFGLGGSRYYCDKQRSQIVIQPVQYRNSETVIGCKCASVLHCLRSDLASSA